MAETDKVAWLVTADGTCRRIGPQPLLLGRGLGCDVVLENEEVSNRHALLRPTSGGVEVEALGRNDTLLNGLPIRRITKVRSGDRIGLPGSEFEIRLGRASGTKLLTTWFVQRAGLLHKMPARPLSIGGGDLDDLRILGWPPSLLTLHAVGGTSSRRRRRRGSWPPVRSCRWTCSFRCAARRP
jgi:pSer/pThr/pTyr-binding forkhead associated (FHA) protein